MCLVLNREKSNSLRQIIKLIICYCLADYPKLWHLKITTYFVLDLGRPQLGIFACELLYSCFQIDFCTIVIRHVISDFIHMSSTWAEKIQTSGTKTSRLLGYTCLAFSLCFFQYGGLRIVGFHTW